MQDGFSWKGVALSALGAGVGAGVAAGAGNLGGIFANTGMPGQIARAALGSTASQGLSVATGLQGHFDWRSVAAAAGGAAAGAATSQLLNGTSSIAQMFGGSALAKATASGLVAGTTAAIVRGGKVQLARIATDAFGNALANSIAETLLPASTDLGSAAGRPTVDEEARSATQEANDTGHIGARNSVFEDGNETSGVEETVDGAPQNRSEYGRLEPQKVGGKTIDPPTEAEVQAQLAERKHTFLKDFIPSGAYYNGKINVIRDEQNRIVTLQGRGAIYGELNFQVAADAMDRWDGLSYKSDDGYTYKSDIKFGITSDLKKADIRLNYSNEPRDAYAQPNGNIYLDNHHLNGIKPGLGAHEVGHAFFGLKDAYVTSLIMPSGYVVSMRPHAGFETSLMGNLNGTVKGPELRQLTLKYEELLKAKVPSSSPKR